MDNVSAPRPVAAISLLAAGQGIGDGQLVVTTAKHCEHCFRSIEAYFEGGDVPIPEPGFENGRHPLFVTLKAPAKGGKCDRDGLVQRGCIGNLSPLDITQGLWNYARSSAFKDTRYSKLQPSEIYQLAIQVSLLSCYEKCARWDEWEVGKHGITIKFDVGAKRYSGTYLPQIASEEGWTIRQAIDSLIRKAGWKGEVTEAVRLSLVVTRYQSTHFTLSYREFQLASTEGCSV